MRRIFLAVALAVCLNSDAHAAFFYDGNQLNNVCSDEGSSRAMCMAYVTGIVDATEYDRFVRDRTQCIRAGVSNEQLRDVVKNYLRDHPADRDRNATVIVRLAIQQAFCPSN